MSCDATASQLYVTWNFIQDRFSSWLMWTVIINPENKAPSHLCCNTAWADVNSLTVSWDQSDHDISCWQQIMEHLTRQTFSVNAQCDMLNSGTIKSRRHSLAYFHYWLIHSSYVFKRHNLLWRFTTFTCEPFSRVNYRVIPHELKVQKSSLVKERAQFTSVKIRQNPNS